MLPAKYTIMIGLLVGATAPACTKVTRHSAPFEPSTEMLHRERTALFVQPTKVKARSPNQTDNAHIQYLAKLTGQNCSDKKWTELTIKALRMRASTNNAESIDGATYSVDASKIQAGDIIYFAPRPRSPKHGVVVKKLNGYTHLAVALIRGQISTIRVNTRYGDRRRRNGQVINSFLRVIKRNDQSQGYLAGALVIGAQRPDTAR